MFAVFKDKSKRNFGKKPKSSAQQKNGFFLRKKKILTHK